MFFILHQLIKIAEKNDMIKFNEIKKGDFFIASNEGDKHNVEVIAKDIFTRQIGVDENESTYWYKYEELTAIPITDRVMRDLKFSKFHNADGSVKYAKGAFRLMIQKQNDFSRMELWYREEKRHIYKPIQLHELQNHFLSMTKVYLNEDLWA